MWKNKQSNYDHEIYIVASSCPPIPEKMRIIYPSLKFAFSSVVTEGVEPKPESLVVQLFSLYLYKGHNM